MFLYVACKRQAARYSYATQARFTAKRLRSMSASFYLAEKVGALLE